MPSTWNLKEWLRTNRGLTDAKEIRDIIHQRTRQSISLQTVNRYLNQKPKALNINTIQAICDAFRCKLSDFCTAQPSSTPPVNLGNDLQPQRLLQPCAIASHETLYSFIARVQLAAIEEAVSISNTYAQAARRLGYQRTSLHNLHSRLKRTTTLKLNARRKRTRMKFGQAVPLPRAVFTLRKNEHLQSFVGRIQLAAIRETTSLEGNHTRAALRLGYHRPSLVHLISKLKARGKRKRGAMR